MLDLQVPGGTGRTWFEVDIMEHGGKGLIMSHPILYEMQ